MPKFLHVFILRGRRKCLTTKGLSLRPWSLDDVSQVKPNGGGESNQNFDPNQGEASSEKTEEEAVLVISGDDDVIIGFGAIDSDEVAVPSGKGVISSLAKCML